MTLNEKQISLIRKKTAKYKYSRKTIEQEWASANSFFDLTIGTVDMMFNLKIIDSIGLVSLSKFRDLK